MSIIRVTKEFRFEGAHALINYDGKCKHIHGHSYILYVTVKGENSYNNNTPKEGMVVDFKDLKRIVNSNIIELFDHALVLRRNSPLTKELIDEYSNVIVVDFQPTSENLISHFASIIKKYLPVNITLYSLRLYETATSYVEWFAQDN